MRDTDRPWLRRDTIFASTPGGLLISNATSGFEITGQSAYELFSRIYPLFNGELTVAQIKTAVSERNWKLVEAMARPLEDHGFLRWIPTADFELISEDLRTRFPDQIAFLAQFTDAPNEAFLAFNHAKILVVGDDQVVDSLSANLDDNGAEQLMRVANFEEVDYEGLSPDLIVLGPSALAAVVDAQKVDIPFLGICPAGDYLWALPVKWDEGSANWDLANDSMKRGSISAEWTASIEAAYAGHPMWTTATSSQAVQRLFGALLAYDIFKGITGAIVPETSKSILGFNALTGDTSTHDITPLYAEISREMSAGLEGNLIEVTDSEKPSGMDESNADEYDTIWAPMVDAFTMPAFSFDDMDLDQVPVKVSQIKTSFGSVFGASPWTTADARIEAIAKAYGNSLSQHCSRDSRMPRVVGVGTSRADAIRRAVEMVVRGEISTGEVEAKAVPSIINGRLGDFIAEISKGKIVFYDHEPMAGQCVASAEMEGLRIVGAGANRKDAQARAAIELLGRRQVGIDDVDVSLKIGTDISAAIVQIGHWYVAVCSPASKDAPLHNHVAEVH